MGDNFNFSGQIVEYIISNDANFSTSTKDVLAALIASKENATSVGIRSQVLGPDIFVTAVDDIVLLEEGRVLIKLKHYDANGYILPSYEIYLREIDSVVSFTTPFENPFLKIHINRAAFQSKDGITDSLLGNADGQ